MKVNLCSVLVSIETIGFCQKLVTVSVTIKLITVSVTIKLITAVESFIVKETWMSFWHKVMVSIDTNTKLEFTFIFFVFPLKCFSPLPKPAGLYRAKLGMYYHYPCLEVSKKHL